MEVLLIQSKILARYPQINNHVITRDDLFFFSMMALGKGFGYFGTQNTMSTDLL